MTAGPGDRERSLQEFVRPHRRGHRALALTDDRYRREDAPGPQHARGRRRRAEERAMKVDPLFSGRAQRGVRREPERVRPVSG